MKLFIDVDNTILEHYSFYSKNTENRTHRLIHNDVEANEDAVASMYRNSISSSAKALRRLFAKDNVYLLTKYGNKEMEEHKQKRLAQVFGITQKELLETKDSNGFDKYLDLESSGNKMDYVKELFGTDDVKQWVLIDDYTENLVHWEDGGGIGIKFFNEYNSPLHPSVGIGIRSFEIFDLLENKEKVKSFFFKYTNPLIVNILLDLFKKEYHYQIQDKDIKSVEVSKKLYEDLISKLKLKFNKRVEEFNYLPITEEYYKLLVETDQVHVSEIFSGYFQSDFSIFKTSLEIDVDKFFKLNNKSFGEYLSIKVLSAKDKNDEYNKKYKSDLYLTIRDEHYLYDIEKHLKRINSIFELFINNNW